VSATSSGVIKHSTSDAYWGGHYVGARRLLSAAPHLNSLTASPQAWRSAPVGGEPARRR
jgi:hypothetical protein